MSRHTRRRWRSGSRGRAGATDAGSVIDPNAEGNERADSRIRVLQPSGSIIRAGPTDIHGHGISTLMAQSQSVPLRADYRDGFDAVDRASFDSFPASDAPSSWAGGFS